MRDYDIATFGDSLADVYDDWAEVLTDTEIAADFLAGLADGGRALELGVGTGRIALPLTARGLTVHGIDASQAMVDRLKAKPGGQDVIVTIGDFAEVAVPGHYRLIYVVDSTFYLLRTREAQRRCLANVVRHLEPEGTLVVQALVPDLRDLSERQHLEVTRVHSDNVYLLAASHDTARQQVERLEIGVTENGVRLFPVRYRYVWPSELDLMAELAGLCLLHRWGGWLGEELTDGSIWHVSTYALA